MPKLNGRVPKYRLHCHSGQAIVTLNGNDHYLGCHGSEESKAQYDRLIGEWLAHGRRLPQPANTAPPEAGKSTVTVNHVIHGFWEHAQVHYRKPDGTPTTELDNYRQTLRPLRRLYGTSNAVQFGPKALKGVREHMIALGWCRGHINKQVSRIKSVFRWAVENELIPAEIHHALLAVNGLQRGRSTAREAKPVKPVPEDRIEAVKPFVSRPVWAMIQLQLLTGARAGELVGLRGVDFKTGEKIWTVDPEEHKTAHHGHSKRIYFGPQSQAILQEFLQGRPLDMHLFNPNRQPGKCYRVGSYRQAIWRACDDAFPPPEHLARKKVKGKRGTRWETAKEWQDRLKPEEWDELTAWHNIHRWHPHQLRHNAATHIRKEFGIGIARIILGHRSASVTEIYAEQDDRKAKKVIRKIG